MVEKTSLSSDMEFIKNFEELKLKQKLLIETLKNKRKGEEDNILIEINSKLDFLVKLFKEAQGADDETNNLTDLNTKIDSLENKFNENFTKLFEKIESINLIEDNKFDEKKTSLDLDVKEINFDVENEFKSESDDIPIPDFKCEVDKN